MLNRVGGLGSNCTVGQLHGRPPARLNAAVQSSWTRPLTTAASIHVYISLSFLLFQMFQPPFTRDDVTVM